MGQQSPWGQALEHDQIDGGTVIENQWVLWARITGRTGASAAAAQVAVLNAGGTIKRRLGLRSDPFQFRGSATGIEFQASGLAGTLSLREVSIEIIPKFVFEPELLPIWNTSTLFLLEALAGKHVISLLAQRQQWKAHRVVDLIAHAFADAAERGLRDQPIHIYRQTEESSVVLRGRLNIARQAQTIVHAPHLLECDVDHLDVDNPFNDVLKWAATALAGLATEASLKERLTGIAHAIPGNAERSVAQRHNRLVPPPQFQAWSDALELARLLASGMTLSSNGGRTSGYSLLFNMERAFERFVEVALARVLQASGDRELTSSRQAWTTYAEPDFPGGRRLGCRPDNLLRRRGTPVMVVDAKYKLLDRDLTRAQEETGTPISEDIYELVAGMFAHNCHAGLLIYPASSLSEAKASKIRTWRLNVFGTTVRIGALPVNLLSLGSRTELAELFRVVGLEITNFIRRH